MSDFQVAAAASASAQRRAGDGSSRGYAPPAISRPPQETSFMSMLKRTEGGFNGTPMFSGRSSPPSYEPVVTKVTLDERSSPRVVADRSPPRPSASSPGSSVPPMALNSTTSAATLVPFQAGAVQVKSKPEFRPRGQSEEIAAMNMFALSSYGTSGTHGPHTPIIDELGPEIDPDFEMAWMSRSTSGNGKPARASPAFVQAQPSLLPPPVPVTNTRSNTAVDAVVKDLMDLDLDTITPLQALVKLSQWQALVKRA